MIFLFSGASKKMSCASTHVIAIVTIVFHVFPLFCPFLLNLAITPVRISLRNLKIGRVNLVLLTYNLGLQH